MRVRQAIALTLEEIIAELRAKGQRITLPRRWTLQVMANEHAHLTCEQVRERLLERGIEIDEATVYRTLQWLKQNRIVAQSSLGLGADVYSLIDEKPHHHLVCLKCHHISDIEDSLLDPLREQLSARYQFKPTIDHYTIFGLCRDCQQDETS